MRDDAPYRINGILVPALEELAHARRRGWAPLRSAEWDAVDRAARLAARLTVCSCDREFGMHWTGCAVAIAAYHAIDLAGLRFGHTSLLAAH